MHTHKQTRTQIHTDPSREPTWAEESCCQELLQVLEELGLALLRNSTQSKQGKRQHIRPDASIQSNNPDPHFSSIKYLWIKFTRSLIRSIIILSSNQV